MSVCKGGVCVCVRVWYVWVYVRECVYERACVCECGVSVCMYVCVYVII